MEPLNYCFLKSVNVIKILSKIFPKVINKLRVKGDNGIIGVIGGSIEYTGAPYYSAITSLKSGADLAHIFCHKDACIPIKCYSPELIVHPGFDSENNELVDKTMRWIKSMHAMVIGPGLGREFFMEKNIFNFLAKCLELNKLTILDADSLWYVINSDNIVNLIKKTNKIILTPNNAEFIRLCQKFITTEKEENEKYDENVDSLLSNTNDNNILYIEDAKEITNKLFDKEIKLANFLNNNIIIKKGRYDIITNGISLYLVCNEGSQKRCGGIGDILTGIIASYCTLSAKQSKDNNTLETCATACYITRSASHKAWQKARYSLTAPDIIVEVVNIHSQMHEHY